MSWLVKLAEEIKGAKVGDVIIVRSTKAKELAERARLRMCPEKKIAFVIKGNE